MSRKSVREVNILETEKRRFPNKHYVYVIQVTWSTGATNKIYRRYSQLFEFQLSLIAQFPVQGGKRNPEERTLPFLPGKKLFGRSHVRDVAEERLVPITEYLQSLISLPSEVSASQIVTNFFEPTDEDIKPIREKQKRTVRDNEIHEISEPILLEQWIVIGDFEKGKKTECSLKEGDVVDVIEKKASGWWFVDNGGNKGWVPASYLESVAGRNEDEVERCAPGEEEEYITNNSYIAQSPDELGFDKGVVVLVIQKHYDGWWLCQYQRREGLIPAAYLEPNTQDTDEREKRNHATLPASVGLNLSNIKANTPMSKSVKYNYKSIDIKPAQPNIPSGLGTAVNARQFIPRRESVRQTSVRKRKERESLGSSDKRIPDGNMSMFVAVADYEAADPGGLSFKEGDTIEVIEKQDTGWWLGSKNGKEGLVPSTYLESSNRGTRVGLNKIQQRSIKAKQCTAKEDFKGQTKDTLSFRAGEVFEIIEKSETGWWYVQNSSGAEGWAPEDLLIEGIAKPKKQAPPSPTKTISQSATFNHLSSVNSNSVISKSKSYNNDLKGQLKPVTPNKPSQPEKPVFQNKQFTKPDKPVLSVKLDTISKPVLSVKQDTISKPVAPEKPAFSANNKNTGTQNNYKQIKIGTASTDKPSYSKVKIGVTGIDTDKPVPPSKPRPNIGDTQTNSVKPLLTSKPKPEEGNVQNELTSMLAKRLQTSTKPTTPANKPGILSKPVNQDTGHLKPVFAGQGKVNEPAKPVLPSRPNRHSANNTPVNNNNNNSPVSAVSKYTTVEENRSYEEGCLSFRKGEVAELIEKGENGWWWMRVRKDEGWVFKDKVRLERGAAPLPSKSSIGPTALEDFRAEYDGSISFKKGDSLQIIEEDSGSGWTWVRVGKEEGWAPTDMISTCK